MPRDGDSSFAPKIVKKRQKRPSGADGMVISLAAKGLTTGGVQARLAKVYGADVSRQRAGVGSPVRMRYAQGGGLTDAGRAGAGAVAPEGSSRGSSAGGRGRGRCGAAGQRAGGGLLPCDGQLRSARSGDKRTPRGLRITPGPLGVDGCWLVSPPWPWGWSRRP